MFKSLTKIADLSADDLRKIIELANQYRVARSNGRRREEILGGKVVAMIFEKPSLRTKVSFEVATYYLGGVPVFLSSSQILASGRNERGRESVPDIAHNLERFCDLLIARVYQHETIQTIAQHVEIPVINALCDQHHPCQGIADVMTISLRFGVGSGPITVSYIGDGNNVAVSLLQACALWGYNFRIASPPGFEIPINERQVAESLKISGSQKFEYLYSPQEAVRGAHIVYTDTFVSMGQESEVESRLATFAPYQVNSKLLEAAGPQALFMHCLPAHRGEEVTDDVMDSERSIVFDQAESRLNVAIALLTLMLQPAQS